MRFPLIAVLLAFTSVVFAADIYTVQPNLSEKELCRLYVGTLITFARYANTLWRTSPDDPAAGYWGNGVSGGNEGIRAVVNTSLAHAVLARHTDALDKDTRGTYIKRAIAGIRYAAETHLTGAQKCIDGKQWGNSWQSAMWAANMGFAAWILRDDLDPEVRKSVERVVEYEADRFLDRKPPGNRWGDTKAEEVGWDLTCICLAANMFPEHPNAPRWREKSIEYMMNVVSVPRDSKDERIVDGRRVRDWVSTVNVHPDFTLENHGFLHPTYTMVSPAEVGQGAFFYAYAGRPIPQAAGHHLADNWRLLQEFMLPCGYWAFPQGMDWALNSDGHIHYLAWLATYAKDPVAAGMERQVAQYIRGHQSLHADGRIAGPSSRLGFAREAILAERLSYSYLYHRYFGSAESTATIREIAGRLNGVRRYSFVDVITHRTDSKFASFSWKNKIMGLVMPIGPGHEGNPYFATPITDGLVGSFTLADRSDRGMRVVERTWRKTPDGFETEGTLHINGGLLKQRIKVVSLGEKTVVYLDRVTALADVKVAQEVGVPVGIENDEFTGDFRILHHQGGHAEIKGPETSGLVRIPGKWANVDGRLGVVAALGSGLAYRDVAPYNRDGAREDFLYGSYSDSARSFKVGQEVARRAVVFFVETSPEETARLADQVQVLPDSRALRLSLPEGPAREVAF
jgi:hypothetical protein